MKDFEIRCHESHLENNNTLYGRFSFGPFLPGQGTTFGNALRRSLLSELSGLAITAFEIVGVMQEFSTLRGLRESVLDLSLNLKQVVLTGTLPCSTTPIGFLRIRGPAIIKAIDLKLPAGVYCVSPEQYIATLASNGILNLKFVVSVGKGHSTQPYALYRSLSKIKLKPTHYFNLIENSVHKESLPFSNSSLDEIQTLYKGGKRTKNTDAEPIDSTDVNTNVSFNKIENTILNDRAMSYLEGSFPSDKVDKTSKEVEINSSTSTLSSPSSKKNYFNQQNSNSTDFVNGDNFPNLRDQQAPLFRDHANTTTVTSSEYVSIQKQIFQRVNPHQVLALDAVFTPILKVNFSTQMNDRFETAKENIVLEIWTNGSIHPKRALEEATLSLTQNFQVLLQKIQQTSSFYKSLRYWNYLQPSSKYDEMIKLSHSTDKEKNSPKNSDLPYAVYNLDIGNLNFSLQTFVQLKKAKINTLSQLLNDFFLKEKSMFFNEKTVIEVKRVITKLGINL